MGRISPIKNNKADTIDINTAKFFTNGIGRATTVAQNAMKHSTPKA